MISIFLLAGVVALVGASERCCVDRSFEAELLQLSGSVPAGSTMMSYDTDAIELGYDYDGKEMSLRVHNYDPMTNTTTTITILQNFGMGIQYFVAGGNCSAAPLDPDDLVSPCVQSSWTLDETFVMGGSGGINVSVWRGMVLNRTIIMAVNYRGNGYCVPVGERLYGTSADGTRVMNNYLFTNYQPRLGSFQRFVVPKECMGVKMSTTKREIEEHQEYIKSLNLPTLFN